jgi:polygalacturonase
VQFFKVSGVHFEGVTFKDSPGWTFWLRDSEDIVFNRVKIVGDQRMINNDGIDFDGCRRMRVTDCDISTGDDCIVMRAIRGNSKSEVVCEDLFVSGCRLSSACQGVRLGCPSDDTIRNARFENCVFRGHNAIMSFHPYHYLASGDTGYCRMFGISFKDWKIESNACAITLAVEGGIRLRDFGNVSFSDMKIKSRLPLRLEGCAETMLKNVTFKNMDIEVLEGEPFKIKSVAGISFDSCSVKSGPGKASEFKESARGKGNAGSSWETDKKKR